MKVKFTKTKIKCDTCGKAHPTIIKGAIIKQTDDSRFEEFPRKTCEPCFRNRLTLLG